MSHVDLVDWAGAEGERLLRPLGDRWAHSRAVAAAACEVAAIDVVDGEVLVAAAYLHDIGYAPELHVTGHHGIDGALYLQAIGCPRLAGLVAHHSGCGAEAAARGLDKELAGFPHEMSATADALTFCDLVTDPRGRRVSVDDRVSEVTGRYGERHPVARGLLAALPEIRRAIADTEKRAAEAGLSVHEITGSERPSR